jgi:hypothetical protein
MPVRLLPAEGTFEQLKATHLASTAIGKRNLRHPGAKRNRGHAEHNQCGGARTRPLDSRSIPS